VSGWYPSPTPAEVERWRDRTPAGFPCNVKAFSLLTQHPTRPGLLRGPAVFDEPE
jgi:uncharacterized protein YecE (DUF72 family)